MYDVRVCGGPLARVSWSAFPRIDRVPKRLWMTIGFSGAISINFSKEGRSARGAKHRRLLLLWSSLGARILSRCTMRFIRHMTYPGSFYKWLAVSSDAFPTTNGARYNVCTNNVYTYDICCTFNWNLCLINNTLGQHRTIIIKRGARCSKNTSSNRKRRPTGRTARELTLTEDRATSGPGDSLPSAAVVGLSI